jgi:Sodium:alanine symporter family
MSAFGLQPAVAGVSGGITAAMLNGVKRGLFSNEAAWAAHPTPLQPRPLPIPAIQGSSKRREYSSTRSSYVPRLRSSSWLRHSTMKSSGAGQATCHRKRCFRSRLVLASCARGLNSSFLTPQRAISGRVLGAGNDLAATPSNAPLRASWPSASAFWRIDAARRFR